MNEKKMYRVLVTETLQKNVIVEAASEREAHQRAHDAWMNGEIVLEADSFQGVEFYVLEKADGMNEKNILRIDGKDSVTLGEYSTVSSEEEKNG